MKKIIFWIGVNVIGIPEAFVHELKEQQLINKSFIHGEKKIDVFLLKSYYL